MYYLFLIMEREVRSVKPFGFVEFGEPLAATYLQIAASLRDVRLRTCTARVLLG
ncbi:hypothetical protein V2S66_29950 [Streptomyces sp. V4-01]|uniref:Uncharacterized protein n=1 Tax=Actinacidiphila polyblastidii TaxID=3110430 RepID=A0ABU7PKG0_9ACTN|nr:hypothetical protein [Streptomyces sp. V4-01]